MAPVFHVDANADCECAPSSGGQSEGAILVSRFANEAHRIGKSGVKRVFDAFDAFDVSEVAFEEHGPLPLIIT